MIFENRKITINTIAESLKLSYGTTYTAITKYIGFEKVNARWVPSKLTDAQKSARVESCVNLLRVWKLKWFELKSRIITSDETWVSYNTAPTASTSREWRLPGENPPERARLQSNRKKVMLTVFWDCKGVIMTDYFVQRAKKGMDGLYYSELIEKLYQTLAKKRRGMRQKNPILLIDNAPIHNDQRVIDILSKKNFEILEHPPYSPDLAPSDYYLFKFLKNWLRSRAAFDNLEQIKQEIDAWFDAKPASFYERAFDLLKEKISIVSQSDGNYLEE